MSKVMISNEMGTSSSLLSDVQMLIVLDAAKQHYETIKANPRLDGLANQLHEAIANLEGSLGFIS